MRLLFVHQNFPGQYRHIAAHYAGQGGHEVVCVGEKGNVLRQKPQLPGARILGYTVPKLDPEPRGFNTSLLKAIHRGRCVAKGALQLRKSGFRPDVIFSHIGWGEAIFLKDIFPEARMLLYCEFYYRPRGGDVGFDPEFPASMETILRLRVLNAPLLMSLQASDWGFAPTRWQQRQFPAAYAQRMSVIHDGIDTDVVRPNPQARFRIPGTDKTLGRDDQVVTYLARNLEPYRGFHIFMRAVQEIQKRCPKAHIVIVGGDEVSYSPKPPAGTTYREMALKEQKGKIDFSRVHMMGQLPYADYLSLLQVSSAHVYLTYPFVLSWSLIESLAAGCLVIGSKTAPVEEAIIDGENGLLVDFFSPQAIAEKVADALRRQDELRPLREKARQTALERYDLKRVCLPAQAALVEKLAEVRPKVPSPQPG